VQEVLLHGLLIKIKSFLEALQFFTVTALQAFTAREDASILLTWEEKKKKRETLSGETSS